MPIEGIRSSSAFLRPLMTKMEIVSNNLANINSVGFKRGRLFVEVLSNIQPVAPDGDTGEFFPDVKLTEKADFAQGTLEQTSNPFDLAIDGPGFFAVQTQEGTRYTRAGNFTLTADGEIVTRSGYPVIGDNSGSIILPNFHNLQKEDIAINNLGEVFVENISVGKLKMVTFENFESLEKVGAALFKEKEDAVVTDLDEDKTFVRQGFLEGSNVDGIEEMIQMIEVTRLFETGQKMMQTHDDSLTRSLEVGRMS
ncbi:MAG: flagellar hook-basal body protein [Bacteroidota bacterium]